MQKIPTKILNKLKCALCGNYLNVTPIVINTKDGTEVCGKCFKILPAEEKSKCIRQTTYESVAEMLLFPCRYNLQGCQSEFPLNGADNHELECPFRFDALNLNSEHSDEEEEIYQQLYKDVSCVGDASSEAGYDSTSQKTWLKTHDPSESVTIESNYIFKENKLTQTPTLLKYETEIYGNDSKGCFLHVRNAKHSKIGYGISSTDRPLKIFIEGAISLSNFQSVFCKVLVKPHDPLYDIIWEGPMSNLPKCAICFTVIKNEIYHCTFGHDVCKNCRGNKCSLCATPINFVPRYCCENFSKGCRVYLLHSELHLHREDCEYREFRCFFPATCNETLTTLVNLKEHLKDKHLTSIILSNLVVKQATDKDDVWLMFAYENLFKCKLFRYEGELEFLVEFIGPHREAENYKFEFHVKSNDNKNVIFTKHGNCVGWNVSPLEKALIITNNELKRCRLKAQTFTYTLNLVKILKE